MNKPVALIVGSGPGISGAFARRLVERGFAVALASRNLERLQPYATSIDCRAYAADAADAASLEGLFAHVDADLGEPEVVLFNSSARVRGPFSGLDANAVAAAVHATAMGAFVTAQLAVRRMAAKQRGALFFTGATASVKGFAHSAAFAMGKFAVRGLAQSLARELSPTGIHVAHFVIDGGVVEDSAPRAFSPDAIARSYLAVLDQPPGAWTWELELRSCDERF